jgi:hypothetical protein
VNLEVPAKPLKISLRPAIISLDKNLLKSSKEINIDIFGAVDMLSKTLNFLPWSFGEIVVPLREMENME